MTDNLDRIIKDLFNLTTPTMFDGPERHEEIAVLCGDYLVEMGYRVIKPVKLTYEIKKLDELIDFFYNMMHFYHPELSLSKNLKKDRSIAKRFVESRIRASDISRKYALDECARIINTVFKYEKRFNFDYIPGFGMFGQGSLGWITDLAVRIMNDTDKEEKKKRVEIIGERLERKAYEKFLKKDSILDKLEKK